eukprot:GHVU01184073.1.p1 GENE.GHVU01184073.1~~GHVU01184073.1.p1  ORF type:complete len:107 (+),score=5.25 GHVU01184073.1:278-598(+)
MKLCVAVVVVPLRGSEILKLRRSTASRVACRRLCCQDTVFYVDEEDNRNTMSLREALRDSRKNKENGNKIVTGLPVIIGERHMRLHEMSSRDLVAAIQLYQCKRYH